jgi:phage terminase large subunit GpA-like protein
VFAIKGRSGRERTIKDGAAKVDIDWRGRVRKNGLVLWHVGTAHAKDLLHGRLQIQRPGPGYIHFSRELSDEWFSQFTGEARTTRRTTRGDESAWTATRKRIEAWDCAVYAIWLEAYFELGKRGQKFWDDLEAAVQPKVVDLFASRTDAFPAVAAPSPPADPAVKPVHVPPRRPRPTAGKTW